MQAGNKAHPCFVVNLRNPVHKWVPETSAVLSISFSNAIDQTAVGQRVGVFLRQTLICVVCA
jgi:hypothetical protein